MKKITKFSNWIQSLMYKKITNGVTTPQNTVDSTNMNWSNLLRRSERNFLKKKTKATIGLLVIAILVLFILFWFVTFTPAKPLKDENEWPGGRFLVISSGTKNNVASSFEVMAKSDDLMKLQKNLRCHVPPPLPRAYWGGHVTVHFQGFFISCGSYPDYTNYTETNTTCLKWAPRFPDWIDGPNMLNHVQFVAGFGVTISLRVWFIDTVNGRSYLLKDIRGNMERGPYTNTLRDGSCVTTAFGDSILIIGGKDPNSNTAFNSVELYSHDMTFFKNLPPLLTPRYSHSCSSFGSLVVVAGGENATHCLDSVEIIDLTSPLGWREFPKLPRRAINGMMINLGGKLVLVGGSHPDETNETYPNTLIKTSETNIFESAGVEMKTDTELIYSVIEMKETDFCENLEI